MATLPFSTVPWERPFCQSVRTRIDPLKPNEISAIIDKNRGQFISGCLGTDYSPSPLMYRQIFDKPVVGASAVGPDRDLIVHMRKFLVPVVTGAAISAVVSLLAAAAPSPIVRTGYHLTARPWKPLAIPSGQYLDAI